MSNFDCTSIILCYKRFSPLAIEITSIILSLIGGIITYFGLLKIPFRIDSNIYRTFFLINIPYFIIIIILNFSFMLLRHFELIYNKLYIFSFCLSIAEIYISLFGIITNILDDSLTLNNMKFYQQLYSKKNSTKYPMITLEEWLYTGISFSIIFFFWINILLLNLSENLLINLKISGSYHLYKLAIKREKDYEEQQKNSANKTSEQIVTENANNPNEAIINNNPEKKEEEEKKKEEEKEKEEEKKKEEEIEKEEKKEKEKDNKIKTHNKILGDSTIVFLGEQNDMEKNLGENEEIK